jgi:hypothetical protein
LGFAFCTRKASKLGLPLPSLHVFRL